MFFNDWLEPNVFDGGRVLKELLRSFDHGFEELLDRVDPGPVSGHHLELATTSQTSLSLSLFICVIWLTRRGVDRHEQKRAVIAPNYFSKSNSTRQRNKVEFSRIQKR